MFYETPQFIRQEVKLMGIITFNQLWLLVGFAGFLVILYFSLNMVLFVIIAMFLVPLGLILTFGQMNGMPMYKIIPAALRHFWLPKYYFWQKSNPIINQTQQRENNNQPTQTIIKPQLQKHLDKQTLDNLSQFLDQ
jgi:hypothetical protein